MAHTHNTPTQSSDNATNPQAVAAAVAKVVSPTPDLAYAIAHGYEPKDIGLRGVFIFLGGLAVSLLVVALVIYGIMMALLSYDRSHDPKASPLHVTAAVNTAPPLQPSLPHQNLDLDDMKEMRQITESTLTTDGHSQFHDRHHIPIETAIEKTVPLLKPMTIKGGVPSTQPSIFTTDETAARPAVSQR